MAKTNRKASPLKNDKPTLVSSEKTTESTPAVPSFRFTVADYNDIDLLVLALEGILHLAEECLPDPPEPEAAGLVGLRALKASADALFAFYVDLMDRFKDAHGGAIGSLENDASIPFMESDLDRFKCSFDSLASLVELCRNRVIGVRLIDSIADSCRLPMNCFMDMHSSYLVRLREGGAQ